jgi:hypothetical protein
MYEYNFAALVGSDDTMVAALKYLFIVWCWHNFFSLYKVQKGRDLQQESNKLETTTDRNLGKGFETKRGKLALLRSLDYNCVYHLW